MYRFFKFFFAIFFANTYLFFPHLFSLTIGSYNISSLQPNVTFIPNDPNGDNKAQGFGWLKNGFTLQDNTTTCSLDLIVPISGTIALNGGTLYLQSDTIFDDNASISSMGSIIGASHSLTLGSAITTLPFSAHNDILSSLTISFKSDLSITGSVAFDGVCTIDGNGNRLSLGASGLMQVGSGASLKLKNMLISDAQLSNIQCVDSTATVTLENMGIILSDDFSFTQGKLVIQGKTTIIGPHSFNFQSSQPLQLLSQALLSFNPQSTFFYNPSSTNQSLIQCSDSSSTITFNNSTFHVDSTGVLLTKGSLNIIGKVNFTSDGTTSGAGIIFGDNSSSANNISILIFPASTINITAGYVVNQNI